MTEYDDLFELKDGRMVLIPTASAVDATFRLVHNDLDPVVITRVLMIEPDHAHKKDDPNIRYGNDSRKNGPFSALKATF